MTDKAQTAASTVEAAPAAADMTIEEFVLAAIPVFADPKYGEGCHVVYSGFNEALRLQYPGVDPRTVTEAMAAEGKIKMRGARGGASIYLPNAVIPNSTSKKAADGLAKMGLKAS
jgi:hypothetical protein